MKCCQNGELYGRRRASARDGVTAPAAQYRSFPQGNPTQRILTLPLRHLPPGVFSLLPVGSGFYQRRKIHVQSQQNQPSLQNPLQPGLLAGCRRGAEGHQNAGLCRPDDRSAGGSEAGGHTPGPQSEDQQRFPGKCPGRHGLWPGGGCCFRRGVGFSGSTDHRRCVFPAHGTAGDFRQRDLRPVPVPGKSDPHPCDFKPFLHLPVCQCPAADTADDAVL